MKSFTVSQARKYLRALLAQVRQGRSSLIMEGNHPVARIVHVASGGRPDSEGRLMRLETAGVIKRGMGSAGLLSVLLKDPPRPKKGGDILKAPLSERNEGR